MNTIKLIKELEEIVDKMQFQEEIEYAIAKIDTLIEKTNS